MDREAWQATLHRVSKSLTQLKQLSMHIRRKTITTSRGSIRVLWKTRSSTERIKCWLQRCLENWKDTEDTEEKSDISNTRKLLLPPRRKDIGRRWCCQTFNRGGSTARSRARVGNWVGAQWKCSPSREEGGAVFCYFPSSCPPISNQCLSLPKFKRKLFGKGAFGKGSLWGSAFSERK